jgi:putative membrane-bound dehydrogenase-like protein
LVLATLCLLGISSAARAEDKSAPRLRVPPGFVIERIAGEPQVVFPMFSVFDDHGRLFVTESSGLDLYFELQKQTRKCRIRLLEDPGKDGRFRSARVFADRLVFPMGVAWRDGKLYVPDPPDVVVLEDAGGRAGKRTVILSSFGHRDNGALHGLTFGPDGLLYLTTGDPDGYKITTAAGQVVRGRSGGLLRCRRDGSHPEVLCRGFENLIEIAFTPRGEILGTDNWFYLPSAGVRDALVHLVEGGLYPRHTTDQGTPQLISGEALPAVSLYPAVALSGLMRYRGEAFPAAMRGNLFSAQHNARKIMRHVLVPQGSTFRTEDYDFVTTDDPDFHPSDVLENADGSLLVVDTGSWYVQHCPTGRIRKVRATGGIYRVRPEAFTPSADPWGLKTDWDKVSPARLATLLSDRRFAVRDRAQALLAARGKAAVPELAALLDGPAAAAVKQRAVWALTANSDEAALPPLRKALRSDDRDVQATAARGLARRKDHKAAPDLVRLLRAEAPQTRMAAAEALAHCGDASALPALWQALAGQPDRFLEHSLIHAVHHLADADALTSVLEHPSPRVRKTALLLLDQPPRPRGRLAHQPVIQGLTAADADLRQTALFVLRRHPEWAEHALGLMRTWLERVKLSPEEEQGLRGLLLAFQGQKAVQALIGEAAAGRGKITPQRRVLVLELLAHCDLPQLPSSWVEALERALQDPQTIVRLQAVRTGGVLQLPQLEPGLTNLADSPKEDAVLRLEALRAVVARRPTLSRAAFDLLLQQVSDKDNPLGRLTAAEILGRSQLDDAQLRRLLTTLRGDALVSPAVLWPALRRSMTAATAAAVLDYLEAAVRHGFRPAEAEWQKLAEALPAAERPHAARVHALVQVRAASQKARLGELEPLLAGGSAERGRAVFFGKKVACATCHSIGHEGGKVGPDLTRIGTVRSGPDLLEAIVVPSASIAQGFESYLAVTTDGRTVKGTMARQSADVVVLRDSSGAEVRLPRDQVQAMSRLPTSLMPEGLDRALSPDELRDLLAFLQSRK